MTRNSYTKERSGRPRPRPLSPPTSDEEVVETPEVSRLALPEPHLTFALASASASRSDVRIVSYICDEGDIVSKPVAFLPHTLEEIPSDEEWYRNLDRDTVYIAPSEWVLPQTPSDSGWAIEIAEPTPMAPQDDPPLHPPQSSTASAFAFFQNHFLNRPERSSESETSSLSSGSAYSRSSWESLDFSDESYYDCEQARGTVNSSTLGGLDVYMRTGSIIHWTHHPQYAARIERSSQPSFLRDLCTWDDDRFDFDPVTPFARDWQSKAEVVNPGGEEPPVDAVLEVPRSERAVSDDVEWERVQALETTLKESPSPGASPTSRKRLRKRRPSQPSPSPSPVVRPKPSRAATAPLPSFKVFAPLETKIGCPNRKPCDNPMPSPSFKMLLPRPRLDALLNCGSKARVTTPPSGRGAKGHEPWVWVDITRRSASSQR